MSHCTVIIWFIGFWFLNSAFSNIISTLITRQCEMGLSVVPATVCPQAFSVVFEKAVLKAKPEEALKQRVSNLIDSITSSVFQYTTRGLFECDKLTYIAQLTFQVL